MAIANLSQLIGKTLLVGITYLDSDGRADRQIEFAGIVVAVEPLVTIERGTEKTFTLPAAPEAFAVGTPGTYRLRSTGEVVVNPDFVTSWTVHYPSA